MNISDVNLDENFTKDLSPEVILALSILVNAQGDWYFKARKNDNLTILPVVQSCAVNFDLILTDASGLPENYDYIAFDPEGFSKNGDLYQITGEADTFEEKDDSPVKFTLSFTHAEAKFKCFNATKMHFGDSPWKQLCRICGDIADKALYTDALFNPREQELLPLIQEVAKLAPLLGFLPPENTYNLSFPFLKQYFEKYDYKKALKIIEKMEKANIRYNKYQYFDNQLLNLLNTQAYEPLWRELYGKISASQEEYPTQNSVPEHIKDKIQNLMEERGFTGTYPHFTKNGEITGVRLANSYGLSYFIAGEKNVVSFVDCIEEQFGETTMMQFISGTALLKKGETAEDIYSCTFNAKGRRLFNTTQYDIDSDNTETMVNIAVKRSRLEKLSKEEKDCLIPPPALATFLICFIVLGGLFAIGFTLLFPLLMMLFISFLDGWTMALEMIKNFPWSFMFWGCWILFGGIIGILTVLAGRK